jgi:sugar (pentulose or hexulose) kinase
MVLKVITKHPVNVPEYGVYSHRLADRWLTGGASNSGGMVLLNHFSQTQLDEMTPKLQPRHPTGLDYYPLPATGERFPVNDPEKPSLLEPRPTNDVQFFQAMLEGMARIELQGYRLLEQLGAPYPTSVQTTGGGANNPAWRAIRETILGIPVLNAEHQDAAYGAALLALKGITDQ